LIQLLDTLVLAFVLLELLRGDIDRLIVAYCKSVACLERNLPLLELPEAYAR
jgi:hypothetical protein